MREEFVPKTFRGESLALIQKCQEIVAEYLAQGLRMTLRQLYYQLVSRDVIPNNDKSYKRIGSILSDARLAGLVDWDAIEDRGRAPREPQEFDDLSDLAKAAVRAYRLPRWAGQESYVELWVEKDALSGVLAPMASEYHVTLAVNKGYSSQSAMYAAGKRLIDAVERGHEYLTILYLGDHDPSGEDMVRDVADRLRLFTENSISQEIEVEKVALTMEQIRKHRPPPNPAKLTDSRAQDYIAKYGDKCWEVDALPPDVLQALIRAAITSRLDGEKYEAVIAKEEKDKALLLKTVDSLLKKKGG